MRIRCCGPLARMAGSSCSCRRAAGHRHALRVCRAGIVEPACVDHDLAILLTKVRQHDVALRGPRAAAWFDAVPASDFTVRSGMPSRTGAATNATSCSRSHASGTAPQPAGSRRRMSPRRERRRACPTRTGPSCRPRVPSICAAAVRVPTRCCRANRSPHSCVPCDGSSKPCCRRSSARTAAARDCIAVRGNRVDDRDHARIARAPQACRCPREGGRSARASSARRAGVGGLQRGDVELRHLHHGRGHARRLGLVAVGHHRDQRVGHDLP
ncbi:aminoglycoside nucleotidyltransferase [Burkholderia diffusa]|uniref:Aminoglycoside nucleotidyltransferase n=1 Tax=Burkholderia diffusa TaxID=488732 RepID=A0A6P2QB81_9BURK|nr:aminoglycoside nucleotidyltransferase [Burkholderia diffusa]